MASFRKQHFPNAIARDWNDWRWQLRHSLRTRAALAKVIELSADESAAFSRDGQRLPFSVTPHYASLLGSAALRRTVIPTVSEFERAEGERDDPLGEDAHMPVPGLVHTYHDKVLLLVTDRCPVYCRFCTRSRLVGRGTLEQSRASLQRAIDYIESTPQVRDVLISGGEPLLLSDAKLEWILKRLRKIPHVEIVRFSTKALAVLPQRITPALVRMLKKHQPVWLSVHFTHPDELTPVVERACARLADGGIPMCSQTVLLKGVNDDAGTIKRLMERLLQLRVKPYYLHQCDAVTGSSQFRTSIDAGLDIIRALHGRTTGYAVPMYMIDAPGGGGKVPLSPDYVVSREDGWITLRAYQGETHRYREGRGKTR